MVVRVTPDMRETIRSAAAKLTGYRRRQFQAEMAVKYCDSSPRRAEKVFGWARDSVRTGLHEHRTGIRCVERFQERGRKKTEDVAPAIAAANLIRDVEAVARGAQEAAGAASQAFSAGGFPKR